MPQHAILHSIAYEAGNALPVQHLLDQGMSIETVDELLAKGVSGVSVIERPFEDVLRSCALAAIDKAGIAPMDVDTVILLTESFSHLFEDAGEARSFKQLRNRSFDLFHEVGIRHASMLCSTYGGCMNFLHASLIARALVRDGQSRNVLLVAAERFPTPASRLMPEAVTLAGDGVAACVISAEATGPAAFRLDCLTIAPYKNLQPGADMAVLLLEMFRAMKNAAADCYEARRMQPSDFRWVVLGDYNRNTSLTYAKLLGFAPERTFLQNVGRLGHIPFDPLINLADLAANGSVRAHDAVLLFLCGPISCGAMAVSAC